MDDTTVRLELVDGYQFVVDFDEEGVARLVMDEPPPLGAGRGPRASTVLAAAVANCLSASALLCLRKAKIDVKAMHTTASAELVRNEKGRLRIGGIHVRIEPEVDAADRDRMGRCLELFEDYCVVTQSVRSGVEVTVDVEARAAS